ncbi:tetratricopeptide repeat protein [Brucepastera parasyntrophica]|uniref:tetratricopeptide repeat protein n=1 Tax=Brucepastera parasyntrophica TaxID=2880008 RepID=UPI0021089885|nr:tetratricopeptide repeat protein [Brucepastera parasyntrophica]ULQ59923.1 tetratricopeptide repeat protein [Brucepastera parasyntrophica]
MLKRSVSAFFFFCISSLVMVFADPVALYTTGKQFQDQGNWYRAIENYQEALRENPSYGLVYQGLAECFYALNEYEQALDQVIKAEGFKRNDPGLLDLHGFILIGLGRLEEATGIFNRVLQTWPNDIQARFGTAEINLFYGRVTLAAEHYREALSRYPENRKALLSLALVSRELGNTAAEKEYISKALQFHGDNPQVFYYAAWLAALDGKLEEAEGRVRSALARDASYDDAYELLAAILYQAGRFTEVIDVCDIRIAARRNSPSAWYLKSLAYEKLDRYEDSIRTAQTGLEIAPEDEILRLFMETVVIKHLSVEDARRASWAQYHIRKAAEFQQRNMSEQALYEYRRALKIYPYDTETRFSYAKLLLTRGYPSRYIEQLEFIQSLGKSTTAINDAVENYNKLLVNSVQSKWQINPLYLEKDHCSIRIFYQNDSGNILHPAAEKITAVQISDIFSYEQRFNVTAHETPVQSYSEAFRLSRTQGDDYFALVTFSENATDVQINLDMYVSKTGSQAGTFKVFRTGNNRYSNALRRLVQITAAAIPLRGEILTRHQNNAVIDLGRVDNILVDQVFDIFPESAVTVKNEGIGLVYDSSKVLGTFTVTELDGDIAQGRLQRKGFFDRINAGDTVVLGPTETEAGTASSASDEQSAPALLSLIRKIR